MRFKRRRSEVTAGESSDNDDDDDGPPASSARSAASGFSPSSSLSPSLSCKAIRSYVGGASSSSIDKTGHRLFTL